MIYPSSFLGLALLPLALSFYIPPSSSGLATEQNHVKRQDGDRLRYVTMVVKPPSQKVKLTDTPKITYFDDANQVVEVYLSDVLPIQYQEGGTDRKKTIRAFQFNPGPGEKPIDCTLDIDETVPWVDDKSQNRAGFTFQARGAEYLWPCGIPDKQSRSWVTVNCPGSQVVCDKAAWPDKV